jgi:hypothetical protein
MSTPDVRSRIAAECLRPWNEIAKPSSAALMSDGIASLGSMVSLTQPQVDLFMKMVESGATSFVAEGTWQGVMIVKALGGSDAVFEVDGVDFRELEAQDLVRPTTGHGYDLTNIGRIEYEQRKNPPPNPRPVGIQP